MHLSLKGFQPLQQFGIDRLRLNPGRCGSKPDTALQLAACETSTEQLAQGRFGGTQLLTNAKLEIEVTRVDTL